MWSLHDGEIDWVTTLILGPLPVAPVVAEAVLDTNDDPVQSLIRLPSSLKCESDTYHRFVKTTPNPKATKKSKGELVGPLLSSSESSKVAVGETAVAVEVKVVVMVMDCSGRVR